MKRMQPLIIGFIPLIFFLFITRSIHCHSHHGNDHDVAHDHIHEPPHLKYSKDVNEAALKELQQENADRDHLHEDVHTAGYGHSHLVVEPGVEDKKPSKNKRKFEYEFDKNGYLSFLNNPTQRLWFYAIGSTLLISALPCVILAFIPIQTDTNNVENSTLLKFLLAFGAGGLLGDAYLHLIPHAFSSVGGAETHSHSHSHSPGGDVDHHHSHDLTIGGGVILGFVAFFIVEKFVRLLRGSSSNSGGHSHIHAHHKNPNKSSSEGDEKFYEHGSSSSEDPPSTGNGSHNFIAKNSDSKDIPKIQIAAFLNLVADFMHNFTDGLAIGASYIAGSTIGIVTMFTVLVHEVPHEIGDFAILVRAGYSKKKAILIQLVTAIGALTGCTLSIWSVDASALADAAEHSWIMPFTAGGFIYIASSSIIPELLDNSELLSSILEAFALILGIFLMYFIAKFE